MTDKELPRNFKQFLMVSADLIFIPLSLWLAITFRWGEMEFVTDWRDHLVYLITTITSLIVFLRLGLYRTIIRYMGNEAFIAVVKGVSISALVVGTSVFLSRAQGIPRSVPFIYWGIALFFIGGSRFLVWFYYQSLLKKNKQKVAIYGSGNAGRQLLNALRHGSDYEAVVFLDDDRKVKGRIINGLRVYRPRHLQQLIEKKGLTQVLLALPSVSVSRRREIVAQLDSFAVQVKTIPLLEDIVSGKAKIEELREVDIEDLLGREAVPPDIELFDRCIKNKVVMVTGAGGSIGSELCRQIIKHHPKQLVLFELSEFALYSIEQELMKSVPNGITITALLGSVQDKHRLQSVFSVYGVDTIYHAAAYKHVPIVE